MLRALLALGVAVALAGCSDQAADPSGDPYAPLAPDELARVLEGQKPDAPGTEHEPPPVLDRPYAHHLSALEKAKASLRLAPDAALTREDLARTYGQAGRSDLARREYAWLLAREPKDARLHLGYAAQVWVERRDRAEALRHARAARALGLPRALQPELHLLLGDIAEDAEDPAAAEAFYREALELDPRQHHAAYRLAVLLRACGDLDGAQQLLRRVLIADPRHVAAHFALGQLLVQRGTTAEGHALLARHERLRRLEALGYLDESEAYQCIVLGNHHALAGEYEDALREFERAVELQPEDCDARSFRAAALLDLGRHDEAVQEWKRVLARNPAHVHALSALAGFHLGRGEGRAGDPRKGLDFARRAVQASGGKDARALALLARALAVQDDLPGALAAADQAVALEPGNPEWQALRRALGAGGERIAGER